MKTNLILTPDLRSALSNKENPSKFPIDIFPQELQNIISEIAKGKGIHLDHLSGSILFAFSYAIGNSSSTSVLPNSSALKPIQFLCMIGNPGANKSAALKFAMKYFVENDKKEYNKYKIEKQAFENSLKDSNDDEDKKRPPIRKQSILKDATIEAVSEALGNNPHGIAIVRDELAGFFRDLNRYRAGSDLEYILEMWSQDPLIINRINREAEPIVDPFSMIGGTTQPKILLKLLAIFLTNGSGLFDRFLFIWPKITERALYQEIDLKSSINTYNEKIKKVFNNSQVRGKEKYFPFSPEAKKLAIEWLNVYNKYLVDQADDEVSSLYSKFDIHFQRFCLTLHLIDWSFSTQKEISSISMDTTIRAIRLTEYFRGQSELVLDFLTNTDPISTLKPYQAELYKKLPKIFKTAEGKAIAEKLGIAERTYFYFLSNNPKLFVSKRPGIYEKL
ncbi:DUF3987 domain-containing protein [Belliella sp. DSM 111904]|uniref:DUF3987 domain-containing protein n=1 Tax=Belliella filtrata TaxID=2923435 RepID=A0ABS9V162_9BACT|nr:DUF3987 domain-containing protein [Belliella filtrata]MCH7409935.1 DUF3987 domain-containing protein [Belliella filtrata]